MRLLSSLLALWVTGVSVAYGYSMPGGYERVLFYYAYVAECAESNNSPSKIGAGCATAPRTCNFNQFMEYIMTEDKTVNIHSQAHPNLPNIETTATALNNQGLTGAVNPGRVYEGAGSNWADLLGKVAAYVERNVYNDDLPEDMRQGMNNALRTVHASRAEASFTSFKPAGKTIKETTWSPYGKEFKWIDIKETKAANPGWDAKAAFQQHIADGHIDNIKALSKKLDNMPTSCYG